MDGLFVCLSFILLRFRCDLIGFPPAGLLRASGIFHHFIYFLGVFRSYTDNFRTGTKETMTNLFGPSQDYEYGNRYSNENMALGHHKESVSKQFPSPSSAMHSSCLENYIRKY